MGISQSTTLRMIPIVLEVKMHIDVAMGKECVALE
jgi:hypothetical protein